MYNEILGCMTIAGTFFALGFAGAVWDFKRAQRKKARERNNTMMTLMKLWQLVRNVCLTN